MSLEARVRKLEATARERTAEPCRWCRADWSWPDDFPLVDGVRPPVPECERPGVCPGGGLLIVIDGDDEVLFMAGAPASRRAR